MKKSSWESLVRTALLGTARAPLSAALVREAETLGLSPADDPVQTVLELLAATTLAHKAAFPLGNAPATASPPERSPAQAWPNAALAPWLDRILSGAYPRALDEWLEWLAAHPAAPGLPPEFMPALLDRAARDPVFFAKIRPALGPRGPWLAQQNPAWSFLYAAPTADWSTGNFAERLRWLQTTRASQPLIALAQLEQSWATERAEQKRQFLAALSIRLSVLDEDFLEKILLTEKKRDLRQVALALLLQIPEGRRRRELTTFFRERLAGVFAAAAPAQFLAKALPDREEAPVAPLLALLPPADAGHWRPAVVALLASCLPPGETTRDRGQSPGALLGVAHGTSALPGLLAALMSAAIRYRDVDWLRAIAHWLDEQPTAGPWKELPLAAALEALPEPDWAPTMTRLLRHEALLASPVAPLAAALLVARRPWPRELLLTFLVQLVRQPFPQPHLRELLENAAYQCRPEDADSTRHALGPDSPGRHPWRTELAHFFEVVQFRGQLRRAWAEAEKNLPTPGL